jgi:hypothetical protein
MEEALPFVHARVSMALSSITSNHGNYINPAMLDVTAHSGIYSSLFFHIDDEVNT